MSDSSSLDNNEGYIKKNIRPYKRGQSAIFGDPISSENGLSIPSRKDEFQNSKEKDSQQIEKPIEGNQQSPLLNQNPFRMNSSKEQQVEEQPPMSFENSPQIQKADSIPREEQHINSNNILSQLNQYSLKSQQVPQQKDQNMEEEKKLRLKLQRMGLLLANNQQIQTIIETLHTNTTILESTFTHIREQSSRLNQFKEETSRKLEENIKTTLTDKMDQINRENTKEIKDIKNMTLNIRDHLDKNDSRIQKMEKNVQEILALLKNKK